MLDEKLLFGALHLGKPVVKENYKALGASKIWETNWKPYLTLDFYASYKISPNVNLSAGNVGDKYYVDKLCHLFLAYRIPKFYLPLLHLFYLLLF